MLLLWRCRVSAPAVPDVQALLRLLDNRDAELQMRLAVQRDSYAEGFERGLEAGRAEKRAQVGLVSALTGAAPPGSRWRLYCPACRRGVPRHACPDCQDRSRETFAAPMPGDYPGAAA